jgi:hypothetical protein
MKYRDQITPENARSFSLFKHLEGLLRKPLPPDAALYRQLPLDLPYKEQKIIDQAREILADRFRTRDRTWEQLNTLWRPYR